MSDHKPPVYEKTDWTTKPVVWTIALAFIFIFGTFLMLHFQTKMYRTAFDKAQETPEFKERNLPPQPRLQVDEKFDLAAWRKKEDADLNSYGWVDQANGRVRIPIARAIDVVAQEGLPTRPQGPKGASK